MVSLSVTGAARQQNSSRPPAFDWGAHARNLRAVALPAVAFGAVVAVCVFVLMTSLATAKFRSSVVAQAHGTSAAPYLALASDGGVLADVKTRTGFTGSIETLESAISVSAGAAPELLDIAARASTAEFAKTLALQMISSMDGALQANYGASGTSQNPQENRLVLLAIPAGSGSEVGTHELLASVLAGIVAAIVFAEIVAALVGRFGSRVSPTWTRRIARKYGVPVLESGPAQDGLPPSVLLNLRRHAGNGHRVLVLTGPGSTLAKITTKDKATGKRIRIARLDEPWWTAADAEDVVFVVASVVAGEKGRAEIERTIKTVRDAGMSASLVVHEPGDGQRLKNDGRHVVWGSPMVPEPSTKQAITGKQAALTHNSNDAIAASAAPVLLTKPVREIAAVDPIEAEKAAKAEAAAVAAAAEAAKAEAVAAAAEAAKAEAAAIAAAEAELRRPPTFDEFGASVSLDDIGNEFWSTDGSLLPGWEHDDVTPIAEPKLDEPELDEPEDIEPIADALDGSEDDVTSSTAKIELSVSNPVA